MDFNSLSAPWHIIRAHEENSHVELIHVISVFYVSFWFSNCRWFLFYITCDPFGERVYFKCYSKILGAFCLCDLINLWTFKMDILCTHQYTPYIRPNNRGHYSLVEIVQLVSLCGWPRLFLGRISDIESIMTIRSQHPALSPAPYIHLLCSVCFAPCTQREPTALSFCRSHYNFSWHGNYFLIRLA